MWALQTVSNPVSVSQGGGKRFDPQGLVTLGPISDEQRALSNVTS